MQPIYHHPSEITTTRAEVAEGFLQQAMRQFTKEGKLVGVANLCKPQQIERLVNWLVDL